MWGSRLGKPSTRRKAAPLELGAGGSLPVLRDGFTNGGPFALKVLDSAHCGQQQPPLHPHPELE